MIIDYSQYFGKKHFPAAGNFDIIAQTDNIAFDSILDVGFGLGGASIYFASKGKHVTALGRRVDTYDFPRDVFDGHGIETHDVWVEGFESNAPFDAVWASHVLEHTANVSAALQKMRSLLHDDGWLFLCVPPHKNTVVSGHLSMGWSLVQLMLVLYFNGFRVKTGHFASHRYNIAAFVQKEPNPRFAPEDGGITPLHVIAGDFPIELKAEMDGQIPSVNWFGPVSHRPLVTPRTDLESAVATIRELREEIKTLKARQPRS